MECRRAVVAVAAVVGAAGNAAANVRIRILFTHGNNLLAMLVAWDSYCLPAGGGKNPHKLLTFKSVDNSRKSVIIYER